MQINLSDEMVATIREGLGDAISRQSDEHHKWARKLSKARKDGNTNLQRNITSRCNQCNEKILRLQDALSLFVDTE